MSDQSYEMEDRQSRFELKTLLDTSRLLIESHDFEFVLSNLLLITMGKLMIPRGAILLFIPETQTYTVTKCKGKINLHQDQQIKASELQNFQDILYLEKKHTGKQDFPAILGDLGFNILLNLKTSDQHLGFLCLGPKFTGKVLSKRERDFIESLTIMSAVAIANSRLFNDLRQANRQLDRKVQELHTLFDISKEFNVTIDRNQITRIFKFALMGQMFVRTFFFALDQGGIQSLMAQNGLKNDFSPDDIKALFDLPSRVIPVNGELEKKLPFLQQNHIKLLVPLQIQNQKIAVIGVGQRINKEPYSESDYNFLISFGNLAVISIQKSFLLEERIEKERLEKELKIARSIQEGLLPSVIPAVKGLEIAARNIPSQEVGGDYYDLIQLANSNVYIAIGDVTGKGIPASLIMANLQAVLHALAPLELSIEEKTARINDIIYKNTPPDKFVTFFWGIVNTDERTFTFVNAGHNPPLLFRKSADRPIELTSGGLILGAMPTLAPYQRDILHLQQGDVIVMYTDGVSEARNNKDMEYEEAGLIKCVSNIIDQPAEDIISGIIDDIQTFSNNTISDDLTLLVIKVH